jgi:hypothetical protein
MCMLHFACLTRALRLTASLCRSPVDIGMQLQSVSVTTATAAMALVPAPVVTRGAMLRNDVQLTKVLGVYTVSAPAWPSPHANAVSVVAGRNCATIEVIC